MSSLKDVLSALFESSVEYPSHEELCELGVPQGTLFDYVASTYLDGFVNYLEPFTCYIILDYDEQVDDDYLTELTREASSPRGYNTTLSNLEHDVIILGETANSFWFLWYDPDTSDCSIGRLNKRMSRKDFEKLFDDISNLRRVTVHSWIGW